MFAYNPGVADRSGEILGEGANNAAMLTMRSMEQIGQSLASIGEMYGEIESQKAKGRAFKDVFKVVSPSLGISMEQLEAVAGGKIKSDRDWYQVSEMMGPMMPSLINMQLGKDRLGVQRNQPFVNAGLDNAANIAAGNQTFTGGQPDPGPVLMDGAGPTNPLPAVAGAPAPAPTPRPGAQTMTREQWDAMNADLVRRGRQSRGPYPY